MIRPGLTFKLSVLLACIGVLASGATGYYAYHSNRTMLVKEAGRSLLTSTELLGERFSAADLLLAGTLQIAFVAKLLEPSGRIGEYVERAIAREGHVRAMAIEQREKDALKVKH